MTDWHSGPVRQVIFYIFSPLRENIVFTNGGEEPVEKKQRAARFDRARNQVRGPINFTALWLFKTTL